MTNPIGGRLGWMVGLEGAINERGESSHLRDQGDNALPQRAGVSSGAGGNERADAQREGNEGRFGLHGRHRRQHRHVGDLCAHHEGDQGRGEDGAVGSANLHGRRIGDDPCSQRLHIPHFGQLRRRRSRRGTRTSRPMPSSFPYVWCIPDLIGRSAPKEARFNNSLSISASYHQDIPGMARRRLRRRSAAVGGRPGACPADRRRCRQQHNGHGGQRRFHRGVGPRPSASRSLRRPSTSSTVCRVGRRPFGRVLFDRKIETPPFWGIEQDIVVATSNERR